MPTYTDEQKRGIIQRMIDAGEPEEAIASVIRSWTPFDVKAQNVRMQANMAKQTEPSTHTPTLADFATSGPMGNMLNAMNAAREGNYQRAVHEAVTGTGKVLAPAALPALGVPGGAMMLGTSLAGGYLGGKALRKGAEMVTDNPDTQNLAEDVGNLAGGVVGGAVGPSVVRGGLTLGAKAAGAVTDTVNPDVVGVFSPRAANALRTVQRLSKAVKTSGAAGDALPAAATKAGVERYNPNVSPASAERALAAPSAASVPGSSVQGNITPPSEQPSAADIMEGFKQARDARNAVFDESMQRTPLATPEQVADSYAKKYGFAQPSAHEPVKVDPKFGERVADAYDKLQNNPNDPAVQKAYGALAREVKQQYDFITKEGGLQAEPWTQGGQPYKNSAEMMKDVRDNNHLYYFKTDAGFGTQGAAASDHPLLAKDPETGMPYNDMLRVVHDYLAHAKGGFEFGPSGEENAYLEHLKLLSPDAQAALATETRGQNSWVNFGPNKTLPPAQRPFAEPKAALLPPELRDPNAAPLTQSQLSEFKTNMTSPEFNVADTASPTYRKRFEQYVDWADQTAPQPGASKPVQPAPEPQSTEDFVREFRQRMGWSEPSATLQGPSQLTGSEDVPPFTFEGSGQLMQGETKPGPALNLGPTKPAETTAKPSWETLFTPEELNTLVGSRSKGAPGLDVRTSLARALFQRIYEAGQQGTGAGPEPSY